MRGTSLPISLLALALLLTGCGEKTDPASPPVFDTPTVLLPKAPGDETIGSGPLLLDISNLSQGYLVAEAKDDGFEKNIQLQNPEAGVNYSYFLKSGETAVLPFTDGDGDYLCSCYQQVEGDTYAALFSQVLHVELDSLFYPFLYPNQYVHFTAGSEAVSLSYSLLDPKAPDVEALDAIYGYVTDHISYDEEKAKTVENGYLPDIDETLQSGKGICFDYAALMTAMLRARNIPCRLVTGFSGNIKHAWIDVFIQEKGWVEQAIAFDGQTWTRMDPTFAAGSEDEEFIRSYIGDGENYTEQYAH